MARVGRILRRTFLVGSVAVAGGVAFGVYVLRRDPANPLLEGLPPGAAAITPHVRIDADGVTLIAPRADVGQGAAHVQALLIAEELDVRLEDVRIEPGPPAAAYWNGAVAAEGMPIAAIDDGMLARAGRAAGDAIAKVLGLQLTGGSTTVPDAWEKLRMAGAVARETLKAAAARETGVPVGRMTTRDGTVILPDGRAIPYTALAATAARIAPVRDVALRPPEAWRLIGRPGMRVDIPAKSTGTAVYGIDLALPGMVFATVRTNPRAGGPVNGFDASAAEAMPGVLRVVPVTGGAAVVATNTWTAFRAAEAIAFDWGPAPYPAEQAELEAMIAASFTEDRRDSRLRDDGDAATQPAMVEAAYGVPFLAHAPLEPMNATALWQGGRLTLWTGTQIPRFAVAAAARILGIGEDRVTLHALPSGGSFGRRLEDDYVRQTVEIARAMEGVPVKMTWSREEDFLHGFPRPAAMARMRGAHAGGRVTALDLAIAAPSVAESQIGRLGFPAAGPDIAIVAGAWDQPYAIPHYRVTGHRVPAMVPVSSWRSVGASHNGFFHECALDEVIWAAGADPLMERIRLCTHAPSRRVLEAVGAMSEWAGPRPAPGRGRGVAFTLSFGVPVAEIVEVAASDAGLRITDVWVAAEVGRVVDPVNLEAQIAGGVIWGLGHAMNAAITYRDGMPEQTNYHAHEGMRLRQTPRIHVRALETDRIRGIGEPAVPPAAAALANAIFAATGQRIRQLPLSRTVSFA
jgi:isoquinoline 1-oxidoreductase beta subunit